MTVRNYGTATGVPRMTRSHFEFIADILNDCEAPVEVIEDVASRLDDTNERFDFDKFVARATEWLNDDDTDEATDYEDDVTLWEDDNTPTEACVVIPFPDRTKE